MGKDNRKGAGAFGWRAKVPAYSFTVPVLFYLKVRKVVLS